MISKQVWIQKLHSYVMDTEQLMGISNKQWTTKVEEGRWAVKDIIAHLMMWDEYFLEKAIAKIAHKEPLTLKHMEFEAFNARSVELCNDLTQMELLSKAMKVRNEIIRHLESISEVDFNLTYVDADGHDFVIAAYIEDFAEHDQHHWSQIHDYLKFMKSEDIQP